MAKMPYDAGKDLAGYLPAAVAIIKQRQASRPDKPVPVVIEADKDLRYEQVMKVMSALQKENVARVGLAVQQDLALVNLLGSDVAAGQVSTQREVALQVGTEIGGCLYALLPTADFRATVQTSGAFPVVRFSAMGTGALPAVLAVG